MERPLALLLLVATCICDGVKFSNKLPDLIGAAPVESRPAGGNKDIDNYIYGMNYKNEEVLAYKGDSKDSFPVLKEGKLDEKKNFIVVTREKKTAQNAKAEIGVVTSNEHRTYPGAMLLANQRLIDNSPDILAIDRAPLTYTVNLPGLTTEGHFTINPTFAEYQAAKEKTLKTWFDKYPKDHTVNAIYQSDYSFAYSMEYLRVKFGLEFKNTQVETSINFDAMTNQEKLIMIYQFKQIFYTVSAEPTKKPSELFASGVTLADVKQKTDKSQPPVMVDSTSYGRTIYVKLETTSTDSEAKSLLEARGSSFDISTQAEAEIKNKLKNVNMQVFVVGGSTDHVKLVTTESFKEVNDILVQYRKFSRSNLGYPISYSAQFVKDNSRAVVQLATDYIETTRTIHNKGVLKIVHTGGFVLQCAISWKEFDYNSKGVKVEKERSWSKNWEDLLAPFTAEIELPGNVENIRVFAREATGLAWEWWRTVTDRSGIPLLDHRTFEVWGTTLSPDSKFTPGL